MAKRFQAGYTLVELMIVMAITSLLAATVFEGQLQLRTQAQFDADVDKIVVSISQARDEATSGINSVGNGTGLGDGCPGGGAVPAVFAGDIFTADNAQPNGPFEVSFYEANPGVTACTFTQAQSINVPSGITVTGTGGRDVFVRTATGGIDACPVNNLTTNVIPWFENGACPVGTWTLNVQDSNGHTSTISVDQSGLAKRLN